MRRLDVSLDGKAVGTLHEGNDIWRFDYAPAWLSDALAFDLSPALPRRQVSVQDGATLRPAQWYFDNLLPEETVRQAVARDARVSGEDAFALLEYLGAESAGSLTLLPPGQAIPASRELRALADEALSARIRALPGQTLSAGAPKRMSLAGAQHKLLVVLTGEGLYEPVDATPSTHVLKPDHPVKEVFPASTYNEYLTMRLARAAKLPVPPVHLFHVPEPVCVVERFDRRLPQPLGERTLQQIERRHIIDACQLLNKARTFKMAGATLQALADIAGLCTNKARTRLLLFRWLAFNLLVANDDSHLKNLSFFVDAQGVALAPHYDLLATCAYHTPAFAEGRAHWPDVPLAIPLPAAATFAQVRRQDLLDAAAVLGVGRSTAARILDEVVRNTLHALQGEQQELERLRALAPPAAAAHLAAATRVLGVVRYIVVPAMAERLRVGGPAGAQDPA